MILSLLLTALFASCCLYNPPVVLDREVDVNILPSSSIQVDYSDTTFMPEYITVFDVQAYYSTHHFDMAYQDSCLYSDDDSDTDFVPVLDMMYLPFGFGVEFYGWGDTDVCYFRITQVDFIVIPYTVVDTWHSYYFYPHATSTANQYRFREYNGLFLKEKGYSSVVKGYSSSGNSAYTSTSLSDFYSQVNITTSGGFTLNCNVVCESFENFLYNRFYRLLKSSVKDYFNQGYRIGNEEGHQEGYEAGYSAGTAIGSSPYSTMTGLFSVIAQVPLQILGGLGGFVVWNTPIISILITFMFTAVVLWIIKRFV